MLGTGGGYKKTCDKNTQNAQHSFDLHSEGMTANFFLMFFFNIWEPNKIVPLPFFPSNKTSVWETLVTVLRKHTLALPGEIKYLVSKQVAVIKCLFSIE